MRWAAFGVLLLAVVACLIAGYYLYGTCALAEWSNCGEQGYPDADDLGQLLPPSLALASSVLGARAAIRKDSDAAKRWVLIAAVLLAVWIAWLPSFKD